MRTRWLVVLLGLSLAANVTLAVALWASWHCEPAIGASPTMDGLIGMSPEEMQAREQLARALCARNPDRAAIEAEFCRLDALRAGARRAALDHWLARCGNAGSGERAVLSTMLTRTLCPWRSGGGKACCAPSPTPGARSDNPTQHR